MTSFFHGGYLPTVVFLFGVFLYLPGNFGYHCWPPLSNDVFVKLIGAPFVVETANTIVFAYGYMWTMRYRGGYGKVVQHPAARTSPPPGGAQAPHPASPDMATVGNLLLVLIVFWSLLIFFKLMWLVYFFSIYWQTAYGEHKVGAIGANQGNDSLPTI